MMTFTVFAAGFLMRPLGAIFLGAYVDKVGRRKGLIVTLSLMAIGTILITFVPGYETIGIIAPILVVVGVYYKASRQVLNLAVFQFTSLKLQPIKPWLYY